jgi:uncharacterized protein (DUF433 family)
MTDNGQNPIVMRTERGLSIRGTRKTLYPVMDYVLANWSREQIRDIMLLTDEEIDGVLSYIAEHRAEVEAEYNEVVRQAEEERRYWEERNRERFAQIAAMPRKPEHAAIWAKIDALRADNEPS